MTSLLLRVVKKDVAIKTKFIWLSCHGDFKFKINFTLKFSYFNFIN